MKKIDKIDRDEMKKLLYGNVDNTKSNKTILKIIILILNKCNNCGKPTEYGMTRMCSGFVGCDNKILINGKEVECYFGDLMPRIMEYKNNQYDKYREGKVYRWRDGNTEYYGE